MYLSKAIIDEGLVAEADLLPTVKNFFDILLGYALIFRGSEDYEVTHDLFDALLANLQILETQIAVLATKADLLKEFFNSKLMSILAANFDMSGESLNKRQKIVLELITRVVKLNERLNIEYRAD